MASNITLSAGVRQNLLSLQNTASLMATTQNRLATGKKVNSALDNPTNFFTASSLQSRAGDLNSLLDSMSNGIKTLEAADNGLKAITKTVESMQSTLRQARQDKSFKTSSYTLDDARSGSVSFSGGAIGSTPTSISLGTAGTAGSVTAGSFTAMDFTVSSATAGAVTGTAFGGSMDFTVTAATSATISGTGPFTSVDVSGGDKSFTLDVGGGAQTVNLTSAASGGDDSYDVSEIQAQVDAALGAGVVTVGGGGGSDPLTFTTVATGTSATVAVGGTDVADLGFAGGESDTGSAAITPELTFDVTVDGGSTQSITINASDVSGVGNNDDVLDDADELVSILNSKITGATAANNSGTITLTSDTTGASSSVTIASTAASGGITNTSGFGDGTGTGAAAGAAKTLSFDVAVDGGSATTVTIDLAAVQAAGNNDGIIDSVAELAEVVDAQLGASVTVDGSGTTLALTSATTGASSSVAITNTTATNVTNTSGIANASNTGTAADLKTVDELVTEINNDTDLQGKIRASNDNGKLRIENLSTSELTVTGVGTGGAVDGSTGTGAIGGNDVRKNLVKQFNELRDQLDKLADDASFNGINLLRGDKLKLTFNETGTSTIEIQAKDTNGDETAVNATELGISTATDSQFDSDATIDSLLSDLGQSLNSLRSQASSFGSNLSVVQNRTEFTKAMMNTLQTGADALVLADTNEEAANMLALQTRQQLSSTALSLASQADQAALRLF